MRRKSTINLHMYLFIDIQTNIHIDTYIYTCLRHTWLTHIVGMAFLYDGEI